MTTHATSPLFAGFALRRPIQAVLLGLGLTAAGAVAAMDLREALDAALQSDMRLVTSRASTRAAEEKLPQARSQLRPSVGLSVSENRNLLTTTRPDVLGNPVSTLDRYVSDNAALTLRQAVFRLQTMHSVTQAEQQVEDARQTNEVEVQAAASRVAGAYLDAMLARDHLLLLDAQKTAAQAHLDGARKALAGGTGTRTDVDQAQARLDIILAQEIEARQNVHYTRKAIEMFAGRDVGTLSTLDPSRMPSKPDWLSDLDTVIEQATRRSPEVLALRARAESARLEMEKASAGHYPTLDFVAQVTRSKSDNINSISSSYFNRTIGLQLNVPIYSGGYLSSVERQALAQYEAAQAQLEGTVRDVSLRAHKEFRTVVEGAAKARALEQSVRSSEVAVDSTRKSQQAGVRTILNVLDAEQDLQSARRDLQQARYMTLAAMVRLAVLTGDAPEVVGRINTWLK